MLGLLRLLTPVGMILTGLTTFSVGCYFYWNGTHEQLPERNELTMVTGTVSHVTQTVTTLRDKVFVTYKVDVITDDQKKSDLYIDEKHIDSLRAATLVGKPITALLRDGRRGDIWELFDLQGHIIEYPKIHEEAEHNLARRIEGSLYAACGGFAAMLIGVFWLRGSRDNA